LNVFPHLRDSEQLQHTASFMAAIDVYVTNPRLSAQYGANSWGVDLNLAEQGYVICFDFSTLPEEQRKPGLTWAFTRLMETFRARGSTRKLLGFALDELAVLCDTDNALIEKDIAELIQIGRNSSVAGLYSYQTLTQLSPGLSKSMDMVGYS